MGAWCVSLIRMVVCMLQDTYRFKIIGYPGVGTKVIELPAEEVNMAKIDELDGNESARQSLVAIARRSLQICWINFADIKKMKPVDDPQ